MSRAGERSKQAIRQMAEKVARQSLWKLILWGIGALIGLGFPALLFFVIIAVVVNLSGSFLLGSFTGLHLTGSQKAWANEDKAIQQTYTVVADQWKNGLDAQQQSIVRSYQLTLPASVLLTIGKFVDNYQKPNQQNRAQAYYNLLAPQYTWVKGVKVVTTKYWATEQTKDGPKRVIRTSSSRTIVWELRKAVVWNGTFTSTWTTKTTGGFSGGVGTETIEPIMASENMTYNHSEFYAAAKRYGFSKSAVDPLWFNAIYSMQYAEYQAGNMYAYLQDPKVMQWGAIFGFAIAPPPALQGGISVANPAQVKAWIGQALQLDAPYGVPSSWQPYVLLMIGHESGGDPTDVNPNLVEYAPGVYEHAEGILQTMSTFEAYAVPGHMDIWNPVDNIAAALRYIQVEYKSPANIDGIGNGKAYIGY